MNQFSRNELLFGADAIGFLSRCHVAVFGLGGVGSHLAEALARGGVGNLTLVDHDCVDITNINRQIIASMSTIGQMKTNLMKDRILDINPCAKVEIYNLFYAADTTDELGSFQRFDYIADAIDTVSSKLLLIQKAQQESVPVISCMGAGNKLDPTRFTVSDIGDTSVCPLARIIRRELRARGVDHLKVVYSREKVMQPLSENLAANSEERAGRRHTPGSVSFVPPVAGLIMAGEIIKDLIQSFDSSPVQQMR